MARKPTPRLKGMEETKRERSVEGKICASIVEKSDIGLENVIVGPNDYTL